MSIQELRDLSIDELKKKLTSFNKESFKLRIAKSNDTEFKQVHLFKNVRRDIARVQTLLVEKRSQTVEGV